MTAPGYRLEPCPFCGGRAERDWNYWFRHLDDGRMGRGVGIHCTNCDAYMTRCRAEFPGTPDEALMADLEQQWSARAAAPQPEPPTRDVVAEIKELLDAVGFDLLGGDAPYSWALRNKDVCSAASSDQRYSEPASNYKLDAEIIAKPEPPADLVERAKAFRREWMSDDAHLYSGEGTPDIMAAFAHEHAAELASAEIAANRDNVIEDAILDRDAAEAQAAEEKARADAAEKALKHYEDWRSIDEFPPPEAYILQRSLMAFYVPGNGDEDEWMATRTWDDRPKEAAMWCLIVSPTFSSAVAAIRARKGGGDE